MATRDLTDAFKAALVGTNLKAALFVELYLGGNPYRFWTGKKAITWDSKTWNAGGMLVRASDNEETQNARSTSIDISFEGNSQTMVALALNGAKQNEAGKIWFALVKDAALENLLEYSNTFANWSQARIVRADNQLPNPLDGAITASQLGDGTATGYHMLYQATSIVSGYVYRFSAYVKPGTMTKATIQAEHFNSACGGAMQCDLTNGTVHSVNSGLVDYGIDALPNGWFRMWVEVLADLTRNSNTYLYLTSDAWGLSYEGKSKYLYVYGLQLSRKPASKVYVETGATAITATGTGDAIISDPYLAFDGELNTAHIDHGADGSMVTFSYTSELARLNSALNHLYSNATQERFYPGDEGFKYCPQVENWSGYWGLPA